MNAATYRKLIFYSSLFITLAMDIPRLLALRKNGVMAHFWHFDLVELLFDGLLNFLFCVTIFYFNTDRLSGFFVRDVFRPKGLRLFVNLFILGVFVGTGVVVQHSFFRTGLFPGGGIGFQLSVSLLLMAIELRIVMLLQESRAREIENEHLRNAYLKSELEVLKGQLNPHFFFNALSSLSAVVREDPRKAQQYIGQLSKVFRYSLHSSDCHFVTLQEEMNAVESYSGLLKMRYEAGFQLRIGLVESQYALRVPHMSLQPLVENAIKHNTVSSAKPLIIEISVVDGFLEVKNNIQPVRIPEPGAGIGLNNLNERYKILMHREIEIIKTATVFIVKLPIQ
ncbi:MAG: histidine kinase [Puia sp.]|nr:histidine kinase [Puia sp.]